jgi:hypothetical protein
MLLTKRHALRFIPVAGVVQQEKMLHGSGGDAIPGSFPLDDAIFIGEVALVMTNDADVVLRRWRDESTSLELFLDFGPRATVFVGGRCVVADFSSSRLVLRDGDLHVALTLTGATVSYEDILARIPADADFSIRHGVCELRIKCQNGPYAIVSEMGGG